MPRITGGCLCGAVRYATDAEPDAARAVICHCTTCQRHSGSAFAAILGFPAGSVAITGPLRTYTEPGGQSGEPFHRRFCPDCGTPVVWQREGAPRMLILAGTLDDTSLFQPTLSIFCESARPWVKVSADTVNHPRYYP